MTDSYYSPSWTNFKFKIPQLIGLRRKFANFLMAMGKRTTHHHEGKTEEEIIIFEKE